MLNCIKTQSITTRTNNIAISPIFYSIIFPYKQTMFLFCLKRILLKQQVHVGCRYVSVFFSFIHVLPFPHMFVIMAIHVLYI